LGLVNGTIGNVVAVNRSVDGNLNSIKIIISNNKEITITKVDIKFEVFQNGGTSEKISIVSQF